MFFYFTTIPESINGFVNEQMYSHIHKAQSDYITKRLFLKEPASQDDSNVIHYVYIKKSHDYLNKPSDYTQLLFLDSVKTKLVKVKDQYDGVYNEAPEAIIYSIRNINNNYSLLTLIKNDYRLAFKQALTDATVNSTMLVVAGLYVFLMLWVISLIHPLNQIKNYIEKIKNGESAHLNIDRKDEIGEVAEALVSMQDELSKQARIREEMIQNISHDLKTPISTIKSYSESIKDGIYPYDTLEKSVDVILEHADRLEKKVYSLITFNKLGYLVDDAEEGDHLNMQTVIQKAMLSAKVIRKDVVFETDFADDVYFHGEEEPWRIVSENLIDNALRYAKSVVRITLNKEGLFIYNDGELMASEQIAKLFKPYEKGEKGNFGLGLSIVKRVTQTYGYHVSGENMNDGVIFKILKPKNKRKLNIVNKEHK